MLEVRDQKFGSWHEAKVLKVSGDAEGRQLFVHFVGWSWRWDDWVRVGCGRLRAPGGASPPYRQLADGSSSLKYLGDSASRKLNEV